MLKRALYLTSALSLSTKDNQLIIYPKDNNGTPNSVPIEDIGYVIIENQQIKLLWKRNSK